MEADLEQWARKQIAKAGGLMLKWTSPGTKGVPDNIVFWPRGAVHFIEFKSHGEVPDYSQEEMHKLLRNFGHCTYVLYDKEHVKSFIKVHKG